MSIILLTILCGSLVGFSLALTGGGGTLLAVPLLLYVVGVPHPHLAIGTSALVVSLNAYVNLWPHARAGHVHWRAAAIFTAAGVLAAFAGSEVGKWVDGSRLMLLFAILVLLVSGLMLWSRDRSRSDTGQTRISIPGLSGAGLAVGTLSGFFGIGGGFLAVPALVMAAGMPMIEAIGTSLFAVGSFGLATSLNYARSGLVLWPVVGQFLLGGAAGGWVGAMVARRLATNQQSLRRMMSVLLLAIGLYMLWQNWPQ